MAQHRKPAAVVAPAELLEFREEDWPPPLWGGDPDWLNGDVHPWFPAFWRWKQARAAWAESHPVSELGGALARMQLEHDTQFDRMRRWRPS